MAAIRRLVVFSARIDAKARRGCGALVNNELLLGCISPMSSYRSLVVRLKL
jgi:hypothetical protein